MKLWKWFCHLGSSSKNATSVSFLQNSTAAHRRETGTNMCTRLSGSDTCRCGATMRGLYCVWSYYRDK